MEGVEHAKVVSYYDVLTRRARRGSARTYLFTAAAPPPLSLSRPSAASSRSHPVPRTPHPVPSTRRATVGKSVAIVGAGGIGFDVAEFLAHGASLTSTPPLPSCCPPLSPPSFSPSPSLTPTPMPHQSLTPALTLTRRRRAAHGQGYAACDAQRRIVPGRARCSWWIGPGPPGPRLKGAGPLAPWALGGQTICSVGSAQGMEHGCTRSPPRWPRSLAIGPTVAH